AAFDLWIGRSFGEKAFKRDAGHPDQITHALIVSLQRRMLRSLGSSRPELCQLGVRRLEQDWRDSSCRGRAGAPSGPIYERAATSPTNDKTGSPAVEPNSGF